MIFRNRVVKNASWIIGCKIVQSVLALVIGMLTARYLGPSQFGVINYAASLVAFATPIMQLGLNNVLVQEFVNKTENDGVILGSSIFLSVASAVLCMVGLFVTVQFLNFGEQETIIVCSLYSTILLFQALELTQYWFQAKLLSKYTSLAAFFAYLIVSIYKTYLLISGKSVYWFAVSNSFDCMLLAVAYIVLYKKNGGVSLSVSFCTIKRIFAQSRYYIIPNMMMVIFAQTDRVMLKNMLGNADVGFYSAALTCAGMSGFFFSALIDSFRPVILESKKNSEDSFENKMSFLYGLIAYFALAQCVLMTLFAPFIIKILYGHSFLPSICVLQIVVWYTTFSYLGGTHPIWILATGNQKYLWIINLGGALCNVVLNFVLIPQFGACGAALASVVTQFFSAFIMMFIVKTYRPSVYLMLRGLNPIFMGKMIKQARRG